MKIIGVLCVIIYSVKCFQLSTKSGHLDVKHVSYGKRDVIQALNIPYAEPPVGLLRFSKPVPVKPWTGVLDAKEYGPACVQNGMSNTTMSEDCLKLNIYIPGPHVPPAGSKAVMIFIHGGGNTAGQASFYDGSLLAINGDVIVVAFNYRLDVLGFLATETENLSGNYGLWDQHLAIRWVKDNIENFGGNPGQITLFGESSGGYSVGLHLMSKHNNGLFQRAICESGNALSPRALAFNPNVFASKFLKQIGCLPTKMTDSKRCLRNKKTADILNASQIASTEPFLAFRLHIGPVVDGDFLSAHPIDLLHSENIPFSNVDLLAGTNSGEGSLMMYPLKPYQRALKINLTQGEMSTSAFCDNITTTITRDYYNNSNDIAKQICKFYGNVKSNQILNAVNMYSDTFFLALTVSLLEAHSTVAVNHSTYQYYFDYEASFATIKQKYPWFVGAIHGAELYFVFGPMFKKETSYHADELKLSKTTQLYWSNFAKYGNPNNATVENWPQYNITDQMYMNLKLEPSASNHLFPKRMDFWSSLSERVRAPSLLNTSYRRVVYDRRWGCTYL